MNGFYVITNRSKKNAGEEAEFIKRYLEDKGCVCYLQSECEHTNEESMRYTDASAIPEDVKCIIALGGDGTLLHASRDLVDTSLPLLRRPDDAAGNRCHGIRGKGAGHRVE